MSHLSFAVHVTEEEHAEDHSDLWLSDTSPKKENCRVYHIPLRENETASTVSLLSTFRIIV